MFYYDLQETSVELTMMLQAENRVVTFIEDEKFKKSLPKDCLREAVNNCAIQYEKEVILIVNIFTLLSFLLYFRCKCMSIIEHVKPGNTTMKNFNIDKAK